MRPVTGLTQVVGVVGWPTKHSLSPHMHNQAFAALDLDWTYVPFPTPPDRLRSALFGLQALGVRGVNVIIPHKSAVIRHLDELDPMARLIGAVNTIVITPDRLAGHNTDWQGLGLALRDLGVEVRGAAACLLGSGGAARAAAALLAREQAASIDIVARAPARAEPLAELIRAVSPDVPVQIVPWEEEARAAAVRRCRLLVNSTSVGMWPDTDSSPIEAEWLEPAQYVYDMVYHPEPTRLVAEARARGCRAEAGVSMLAYQGAAAQVLWTGVTPPVEVMAAAVRAAQHR